MNAEMHVRRAGAVCLLLCVLVAYVAHGLTAVRDNTESSTSDQRSFLRLAIDGKDGDALTDGNRNPLYPALVAPFAHRTWGFFTTAKLFSLGLGILCLLLFFLIARRLGGDGAGLAAAFLLSKSAVFGQVTSHVMAESLLVPLFLASWYLTVRGFDSDNPRNRLRLWAAAGATAGLVYLTKATGQLLVMTFVPISLLVYRRQLRRVWPAVLGYVGAYGAVSCPLWIYNLIEHGNPFYNYNTTHAMWLDAWEDKYARADLPTWQSYMHTHSPAVIVEREWAGLRDVLPILGDATRSGVAGTVLVCLVVLVVLSALLDRSSTTRAWVSQGPSLLFSGSLIVLHYVLFAWYLQVYKAARFFLPLTPIIFAYGIGAVVAAATVLTRRWRPSSRTRRAVAALYVALCLCLGAATLQGNAEAISMARVDPFASDREQNAESDALFAWMQSNLAADRAPGSGSIELLYGPSTTLGTWVYENHFDFEEIPSDMVAWDDLEAYIRQEGSDYALLDTDAVWRRPALLSPYFDIAGSTVTIKAPPPGWALTYAAPASDSRWLVFQLLDRQPIRNRLSLTIGDGIRLIGYDVATSEVHPGGRLRFTLYWQSVAVVDEDYTVFAHLLGPESEILAQADRQPLDASGPTTTWLPEGVYADRIDMPIPQTIGPGEARLAIGMYLLRTMERLPIRADDGQRATDDRAILPTPIAISAAGP